MSKVSGQRVVLLEMEFTYFTSQPLLADSGTQPRTVVTSVQLFWEDPLQGGPDYTDHWSSTSIVVSDLALRVLMSLSDV